MLLLIRVGGSKFLCTVYIRILFARIDIAVFLKCYLRGGDMALILVVSDC